MTIYYILNFVSLAISIYTWVLLFYAFLSWFPSIQQSAIGRFIHKIVDPYLGLFDKIPTRFGIFDFKVFIGMIVLLAVQRFLFIIF
ncbi:MAG: YggT family protein [Streptococcaceae bacterium]|jgi:YggT family protein|nr:YggT family protein [Streptococcaceae bacterium]